MKTIIHMYDYVHTSVVQLRCFLYTCKKEICQRKPDIRQTKIKVLQKIYEKNCYGPQGSTRTLLECW
jgi:hypothetical protein